MYERFAKLLELNGLTASEVARKSGISTTTISDWKHGRSTPKHDKLAKIAKALGVSVDYLNGEITWEEEVSRQFEEKKKTNLELALIVNEVEKLKPELQSKVQDYVQFLLFQQNQSKEKD